MGELLGLSSGIVAKLKDPPANWVRSITFSTGMWFHTYQPATRGGERARYYFIPSTAGDEPRSSMRGAAEREANNKARGDQTLASTISTICGKVAGQPPISQLTGPAG